MKKILSVNNVSKKYGDFYALNNVSFDLYEQEIVGFVGPNGAGKSTMMKCLVTLINPSKGDIVILDKNLASNREYCLSNISAQIENPGLYPDLSGHDNLKIFATLKNCKKEDIDRVANELKITTYLNKKVANYSLGMKQRLGIAITLLNKPKIIILDEPTNGLDYNGVLELNEVLIDLKKNSKITILISSHYLSEIEKVVDRVIWINKGKIIENDINEIVKSYRITLKNKIDMNLLGGFNIKNTELENEMVLYMQKENDLSNFIKQVELNNNLIIDIDKIDNTLVSQYMNKIEV